MLNQKQLEELENSLMDEDELYLQAKSVVLNSKRESISCAFLQRQLKVGFSRASVLMDMLEEAGIVVNVFSSNWQVSYNYKLKWLEKNS